MTQVIVIVQAAATWALVGLIWTMQIVHYPLFAGFEREDYTVWQRRHMARVAMVVTPLMTCEAAAALAVFAAAWRADEARMLPWAWTGLGLLVGIWASTAFIQAPIHGRLTAGFDSGLHRRLVATNWIRTALWTVRGAVVLVMLTLV